MKLKCIHLSFQSTCRVFIHAVHEAADVPNACQMLTPPDCVPCCRCVQLAYYCFSLAGSALLLYWAMERMDPNRSAQVAAVRRKKQLEERLGRKIPTLQGLEAASGVTSAPYDLLRHPAFK